MTASDRASILILTCHGPRHYAVIDALARSHVIKGIVFEHHQGGRLRLMRRRLRKLGILTVANQLMFKIFDTLILQASEEHMARAVLGQDCAFDGTRVPKATILDTISVNSSVVRNLAQRLKPDVVVVSGTSLLDKALLASLGSTPVINIHCGITPRYRGTHGAYWAVVNGDWENVGTTIHFIDTGVDTGSIIGQTAIPVDPHDTPQTLALKQYAAGIPLISEAVSRIRAGTPTTMQRPDLDSRIYSSPTLSSYLVYRKRMRERSAQVPDQT
jgi:methionyl-tRNA formyltransferase